MNEERKALATDMFTAEGDLTLTWKKSYSSVILTFPKTNKKMKNSDSSHETGMIEKPDVVPENKQTPNHHKNLQRNCSEDKKRPRKRPTGRTHSQHPGRAHATPATSRPVGAEQRCTGSMTTDKKGDKRQQSLPIKH